MISQKSVQEILDRARVEEVVEEFINLRKRGANLLGLCPFHNEKTPSFTVSPSKGLYKCFGCGKAGNAVGFIMEHEQMSFPEALRYLAKKYQIEIEETQTSQENIKERQHRDSLFIINDYAQAYYQKQLFETDTGKSVGLSYFKNRGYREETIRHFGLGFAPAKKDAFTLTATQDGHKLEVLKSLGLTTQYGRDFFRDRVMFTLHNLSGKVIGFAGRILQKNVKAPKYINSPETEIYLKSKFLYGAHQARKSIRKNDECILVEGYTDVISLHQAGIENVVASSGTSLTVEQIGLIKRFTPNIKILYDGDAAGVKAALRGLDLVLEQDMNVKVVLLPEGEDPDSYMQKVGITAFQEYLSSQANDFILFKTQLLMQEADGDPIKKTNLIKDIVGSIARIPDDIKRSIYIKQCASVMDIEEEILIVETTKVVKAILLKERKTRERFLKPLPAEDKTVLSEPDSKKVLASASGLQLQEREVVRILISHCGKIFDKEENITVEEYVLHNIREVIDNFQNKLYHKIVTECLEKIINNENLSTSYFTSYADKEVQQLAIDLVYPPYDYSPNWEAMHGHPLQNQLSPELNFIKDSMDVIHRYKTKMVDELMADNKIKLKKAQEENDELGYMTLLRVHTKLLEMRSKLASYHKTVILK